VKFQQMGRSLSQLLDEGLRLNYNKLLDRNVYVGINKTGTYGIVNNPNVAASSVALGASNLTTWVSKTPIEILRDINTIIQETWAASEYDLSGMANHILIPPTSYEYLQTPVTLAGASSILEYVLKNNIGKNQGVDVKIYPRRWCINAGVGNTNRMIAYANTENRINLDNTFPLSRMLTASNVLNMSIDTAYIAQFSQVKFLFYQCVKYADGI